MVASVAYRAVVVVAAVEFDVFDLVILKLQLVPCDERTPVDTKGLLDAHDDIGAVTSVAIDGALHPICVEQNTARFGSATDGIGCILQPDHLLDMYKTRPVSNSPYYTTLSCKVYDHIVLS